MSRVAEILSERAIERKRDSRERMKRQQRGGATRRQGR